MQILVIHSQMLVINIKIVIVIALEWLPQRCFMGCQCVVVARWIGPGCLSDESLLYRNGLLIMSMCYITLAPPQSGYQLHGYTNSLVIPLVALVFLMFLVCKLCSSVSAFGLHLLSYNYCSIPIAICKPFKYSCDTTVTTYGKKISAGRPRC